MLVLVAQCALFLVCVFYLFQFSGAFENVLWKLFCARRLALFRLSECVSS